MLACLDILHVRSPLPQKVYQLALPPPTLNIGPLLDLPKKNLWKI